MVSKQKTGLLARRPKVCFGVSCVDGTAGRSGNGAIGAGRGAGDSQGCDNKVENGLPVSVFDHSSVKGLYRNPQNRSWGLGIAPVKPHNRSWGLGIAPVRPHNRSGDLGIAPVKPHSHSRGLSIAPVNPHSHARRGAGPFSTL